MIAVVQRSNISGTVTVPASKSAMQRACAAALIKKGTTRLKNPGVSADDQAALNIIQQLGAQVKHEGEDLVITSDGIHANDNTINAGESGLSVRMFIPIAAVLNKKINVEGSGSLLKRPLTFFEDILPQLGVECVTNGGLLPLHIKGPLQPRNITVDGSLSSQFLTGLLYAYSAADAKDVAISVDNLKSKPYVDLTLQVMEAFGLKTPISRNYSEFYFPAQSPAEFSSHHLQFAVEGDWSGAAFLMVAAAIAGNTDLKGLDPFSAQADKAIWKVLPDVGVTHSLSEDTLHIGSPGLLNAFAFDATDSPDLFPPLVALAAFCEGTTRIKGVERLTHKESNRAQTLQEEFGKLGVEIRCENDVMMITGVKSVKATTVSSRHDHRIAMACAVAALRSEGEVRIENAEAVNKSYPGFWKHLKQIHGSVTLID